MAGKQAHDIRSLIFGNVKQEVIKAFEDPEIHQRVELMVAKSVEAALKGPAFAAAVMTAMRSALAGGAEGTALPDQNAIPRAKVEKEMNGKKKCEVIGCKRPYRSMGYCAAHYQSGKKYGWPMPATKAFSPPPRPAGRPAQVERRKVRGLKLTPVVEA